MLAADIVLVILLSILVGMTIAVSTIIVDAIQRATLKELKVAVFFLMTLLSPLTIKYFGGAVWASKCMGVALLATAQYLLLPVHPFLFPPASTFATHLRTFIVPGVVIGIVTIVLRCNGFMPGYPPLGDAGLVSSFAVVFAVFFPYLVLFGGLIRNGYSRQWANVALIATLLSITTSPFHPNPMVTIVSALVYGAHPVYAVHVAAVAAAVIASKLVERARVALVAKEKKED